MQYWVGITDSDWFENLRRRGFEEVNFWQPSWRAPRRMEAGWPFLFKLHSPRNYIVGGGFFVRFTAMPSFLAWHAFGEKNGVSTMPELVQRVEKYRKTPQSTADLIGCNLLTSPFFFEEDDWIPIPKDWPRNVQRGYTYNTETPSGATLWRRVRDQLARKEIAAVVEEPLFGKEFLTQARLGQGTFRTLVTDAYERRCAVTGERSLSVLEAAHIRAHRAKGPNQTRNGLLLRADIHRLFDDGYVTVDPNLRFVVSPKLRDDFGNGRIYYGFSGKPLMSIPTQPEDRPAPEFLEWHRDQIYVG
ncbi:MAG: HNH endonuclease [Gammaproteobacteria bacterium]|nr:HNH endonuclease [Gammaproteobacteria bacterium]